MTMVGSRKVKTVLAVAALLVGLSVFAPAGMVGGPEPAEASGRRSLNMGGYCRSAFKGSWLRVKATHGAEWNSWRCVVQTGRAVDYARNPLAQFASIAPGAWRLRRILPGQVHHYTVNFHDVCRWQYGSKWGAGMYASRSWSDVFCFQVRP